MTTASLALKPSTSLIARLISDGLRRTALVRWWRVLTAGGTAVGVFVAAGPAAAVPDVGSCGVIGVSLRAVGLERARAVFASVGDGPDIWAGDVLPALRGREPICSRSRRRCLPLADAHHARPVRRIVQRA